MAEDIIYPAAICRLRTVRRQLACGNRYRDVAALKTAQMYIQIAFPDTRPECWYYREAESRRASKVPLRIGYFRVAVPLPVLH